MVVMRKGSRVLVMLRSFDFFFWHSAKEREKKFYVGLPFTHTDGAIKKRTAVLKHGETFCNFKLNKSFLVLGEAFITLGLVLR